MGFSGILVDLTFDIRNSTLVMSIALILFKRLREVFKNASHGKIPLRGYPSPPSPGLNRRDFSKKLAEIYKHGPTPLAKALVVKDYKKGQFCLMKCKSKKIAHFAMWW